MGQPPQNLFARSRPVVLPLGYAVSAVLVAVLTGCANPSAPKPPSLHLPQPPAQLTASRVGDHVALAWNTSGQTTDGQSLRGPVAALICREDHPLAAAAAPAAKPQLCQPVQRITVKPGPTHVDLALPAPLLTGNPRPIAFRVELRNDRDRSAGPSAPVYTLAGQSLHPPSALQIAPVRNGLAISWAPDLATAGLVRLHRTLLATAAGPYTPLPRTSGVPASARSAQTDPDVTLEAGKYGDAGGMIDRTIHDGDTATYTAFRFFSFSFVNSSPPASHAAARRSGRAAPPPAPAGMTLSMTSETTSPVTVTFHDAIPPSVPTGLEAVPGGGFGELPSIDLSWSPNPEPDLLGYNVFRADSPTAGEPVFRRLNPRPIPGFGFRDLTARPGVRYLYRITAVDRRDHESAPGPDLPATTGAP